MSKTPEPLWRILKKDGAFEIRRYNPMIVAEVSVNAKRRDAIREGFRMLAAYIFGSNTGRQKIEMTAPVTQHARTYANGTLSAPLPLEDGSLGAVKEWKIRFILPAAYSMQTLPKPTDSRISLLVVPSFDTAVVRFSGMNTDSNLSRHQADLKAWLVKNNLSAMGQPTYAFYNPPWTLPMLRRNEVMISL